MRRTLTVILASDVADYSRLVAAHEEETIARFRQAAGVFTDLVKKYHGTVFNTAGDAILARFDSAVDAARCAIDIQDANNAANDRFADDDKLLFRIGIAIGDVLVTETGDLLGDAVNLAARLEGIADAGGICISDDVRAQVLNKIRLGVVDLGDQSLHNLPRAVRVYKLVSQPDGNRIVSAFRKKRPLSAGWLALGAGAAGAVILGVLAWYFSSSARDATVGSAEAFDASKIPLVPDGIRRSLSGFGQEPEHKAIAISREGWGIAVGAPDTDAARRDSMERCRQRDEKGYCRIYAVGNAVLMPKLPLPLPADVHVEASRTPLSVEHVPFLGRSMSAERIEQHLQVRDNKGLAIHPRGMWSTGNRRSEEEAARLAVERCTDSVQRPCLLIAINGFLTVQIPRTHVIRTIFTLAGDRTMSAEDKERIGKIYSGKDWRAIAQGGLKHWYAVSGMDSETAAIDEAMKLCRSMDPICAIYAINNFRVAEQVR